LPFTITPLHTGVARLSIEGSLDQLTSSVLRPELSILLRGKSTCVELDLSGLRAIDNSGAGLLLSFVRRAVAQGVDLVLSGCQEQPAMFLDLVRTVRVLDETKTAHWEER
jgi:anti-anti-sigma factor